MSLNVLNLTYEERKRESELVRDYLVSLDWNTVKGRERKRDGKDRDTYISQTDITFISF